MTLLARWIRAFGNFWWDFLVGDTPELFVGVLIVLGVAFGCRSNRTLAVVMVPLAAVVVLVASTIRGRRRA